MRSPSKLVWHHGAPAWAVIPLVWCSTQDIFRRYRTPKLGCRRQEPLAASSFHLFVCVRRPLPGRLAMALAMNGRPLSVAVLTRQEREYSGRKKRNSVAYDMPGHIGVNSFPLLLCGNEATASVVLILERRSVDFAPLERALRSYQVWKAQRTTSKTPQR